MQIQFRIIRTSCRLIIPILMVAFVGCKETLMHNLGEIEANTIMMHLHSEGIKAQKNSQADGAWSIVVPQADSVRAMQTLSNRRMLRKAPPVRKSSSSMLASREEQNLQYERSLSAEMEYTLTAMPGVLDARVHLNLPERDPLLGEVLDTHANTSGSVLLVLGDRAPVNDDDIQRLVSGASGIPADKIAVLRTSANQSGGTKGAAVASALPHVKKNDFIMATQLQTVLSILVCVGAFIYGFFVVQKYRKRKKLSTVAEALHTTNSIANGV